MVSIPRGKKATVTGNPMPIQTAHRVPAIAETQGSMSIEFLAQRGPLSTRLAPAVARLVRARAA
jgi:hypothetical protein